MKFSLRALATPTAAEKVAKETKPTAIPIADGKKKKPTNSKKPGRYEPSQSAPRKSEKRQAETRDVSADYPLIDRVPTAMGYHSDGSEDEWLEEKSRCSRYTLSGAQLSDAEDDDAPRDTTAGDDPEDTQDKYSKNREKMKKKKKKQWTSSNETDEQPVTISRLWSQSTDSDSSPPKWGQDDEKDEIVFDAGDVSFPEEKGGDPIYDGSPKKNSEQKATKKDKLRKGKKAPRAVKSTQSPGSPTHGSDTSTLTDPLENMLAFAATSKVVKEIEEKLKILKKVAKEERVHAKKIKKSEGKKAKKAPPQAIKTKVYVNDVKVRSPPKKPNPTADRKALELENAAATAATALATLQSEVDVDKTINGSSEVLQASKTGKVKSIDSPNNSTTNKKKVRKSWSKDFVEMTRSISLITKAEKDVASSKPAAVMKPESPALVSQPTIPSSDAKKVKKSVSKDMIEMTRSMSIIEPAVSGEIKSGSRRPFLSMLSKPKRMDDMTSTGSLPTAESTDHSEIGETEAEEILRVMYTKSLLTEESDVEHVGKPTTRSEAPPAGADVSMRTFNLKKKSTSAPLLSETRSTKPKAGSKSNKSQKNHSKSVSSKNDERNIKMTRCPPPGWNFGVLTKSSDVASPVHKKADSFWSKRKERSLKANEYIDRPMEKPDCQAAMSDLNVNVARDSKKKSVNELDEYSGVTKETNNEADVVQCLRYYSCSAIANQVNTAINVTHCGDVPDHCTSEDHQMSYEARYIIHEGNPSSSPVAAVEVVLDDDNQTVTHMRLQSPVNDRGGRRSIGLTTEEFLELEEAPPLPLSRVPSVVVDVSGMKLHLDEDSEMDRKSPASSAHAESRRQCDVSITSIILPNATIETNDNDDSEKYAEDEELELDEYMHRINKKKGIRGLWARFKKKQ